MFHAKENPVPDWRKYRQMRSLGFVKSENGSRPVYVQYAILLRAAILPDGIGILRGKMQPRVGRPVGRIMDAERTRDDRVARRCQPANQPANRPLDWRAGLRITEYWHSRNRITDNNKCLPLTRPPARSPVIYLAPERPFLLPPPDPSFPPRAIRERLPDMDFRGFPKLPPPTNKSRTRWKRRSCRTMVSDNNHVYFSFSSRGGIRLLNFQIGFTWIASFLKDSISQRQSAALQND